jgi:hypothetical protein
MLESEDDVSMERVASEMFRGRRRMPSPGNGFGLHLVNVSNHLTTGGLSVSEVESQFELKLGDMSVFDSFMDFNAQFYTPALATYVKAFEDDDVPLYKTSWTYEKQTWTSVFIHVPNTQLTIELIQDVELDGVTETSEIPRIGAKSYAVAKAVTTSPSSKIVTSLAVNRAVSSATFKKLDDFYVTGMKTEKVDVAESGDVSRVCYLWTGASVNICFYNRPGTATKGDWKVSDFESMLNTVHSNILGKNPLCGEDKWFDNHYAIDSRTQDTSNIVPYIEQNNVLHYCAAMGPFSSVSLHYVIDPTGTFLFFFLFCFDILVLTNHKHAYVGWGIQLDLSFDSTPSDCSSSSSFGARRQLGTFNPACDPGTCDA